MPAPDRREFLRESVCGVAGVAAAAWARGLGGQQTNFQPMNQGAHRPVIRPAKPGAERQLTDGERDALEKELKCQCTCILDVYTCRTTDFTCGVSPAMHRDVVRMVEGGYDRAEIKAAFVETYGEVVLTAPVKQGFNWLGYLAPGIVMATGGVILTMMLRRWSAQTTPAPAGAVPDASAAIPAGTSDEELARLAAAIRDEGED